MPVSTVIPGPADLDLDLVEAFVNTRDRRADGDELETPRELATWFADRGLLRRRTVVSERQRLRAVGLREALRALMLHNNGAPADPAAAADLERAAQRGRLTPRFSPGGGAELLPAAGGVDGALAALLVPVVRAMQDGTWSRMKACRADDCQWAFRDRSRNQSGVWCDMAECGNREKVRAYRRRASRG